MTHLITTLIVKLFPVNSSTTITEIKPVLLSLQHDPPVPPQGLASRFDQWLQYKIPCWDSIFQLQASPAKKLIRLKCALFYFAMYFLIFLYTDWDKYGYYQNKIYISAGVLQPVMAYMYMCSHCVIRSGQQQQQYNSQHKFHLTLLCTTILFVLVHMAHKLSLDQF